MKLVHKVEKMDIYLTVKLQHYYFFSAHLNKSLICVPMNRGVTFSKKILNFRS